jgi:hypothetical protein
MNFVSSKKNKNRFGLKLFFIIFFLLAILFAAIFANITYKVRNINFTFFDEKRQNQELKVYVENILRNKANTFLGYLFIDESEIVTAARREFQIVSDIKIAKSLNLDLNVVVTKNEEFFYTCVGEETGFLARCMVGNVNGVYYSSMDNPDYSSSTSSTTERLIKIDINTKVLFDPLTSKKIEEPDSLSGSQIYTSEDFKVLREIIKWVQKNGFKIEKVYVDELHIVDIYTDYYKIKISLDKGYVETVKDFETISKAGNLQKYINEDKEAISYIDLSYNNKVFYKLKKDIKVNDKSNLENDTSDVIMSTTTEE